MTVPAYSAISSYSRVRLLRLLQLGAKRTISELCAATGLHANTVREHLQRLIDGGYIVAETEHRTTRGRPRVLYSAAGTDAVVQPCRDAARRARPPSAATSCDGSCRGRSPANFPRLPSTSSTRSSRTSPLRASIPLIDETELTVDLTPCLHATALAAHRAGAVRRAPRPHAGRAERGRWSPLGRRHAGVVRPDEVRRPALDASGREPLTEPLSRRSSPRLRARAPRPRRRSSSRLAGTRRA